MFNVFYNAKICKVVKSKINFISKREHLIKKCMESYKIRLVLYGTVGF